MLDIHPSKSLAGFRRDGWSPCREASAAGKHQELLAGPSFRSKTASPDGLLCHMDGSTHRTFCLCRIAAGRWQLANGHPACPVCPDSLGSLISRACLPSPRSRLKQARLRTALPCSKVGGRGRFLSTAAQDGRDSESCRQILLPSPLFSNPFFFAPFLSWRLSTSSHP